MVTNSHSIWGVRRARPWLQQSMVYWTVLTLGPLALVGGVIRGTLRDMAARTG